MEKNNIKKINVYDEEYPEKLKSIYDKPLVLYAEGNIELLKEKSIAIVGSRECSKYGMNVSENYHII